MEAQVEARRVPGGGGLGVGGGVGCLRPGGRELLFAGGGEQPAGPGKRRGHNPAGGGGNLHSPERTAALEEIAAKYMADFPQTRVEIVTVEDSQEALAMLEDGQADLVELSQQEQPGAVEQGLLVDLEPYLDVWEERSSLTMAAKAVLSSMGNGRAFLMPITLNQDLVYYRSDWFEAYNQDKTEGLVYCRIWEDFIDAAEKLSDKGAAGLVFGGQEHLVDLFDSVLWSTTNVGRMADTAASYFSNVEGNTTLFTLEHAASAVEQFAQLVEGAVPQEALTWTEDQAVEAFINGEAITLIAGQDRMEEIAAAMDEGAWDVAGYPRGTVGLAVTSLSSRALGWRHPPSRWAMPSTF